MVCGVQPNLAMTHYHSSLSSQCGNALGRTGHVTGWSAAQTRTGGQAGDCNAPDSSSKGFSLISLWGWHARRQTLLTTQSGSKQQQPCEPANLFTTLGAESYSVRSCVSSADRHQLVRVVGLSCQAPN